MSRGVDVPWITVRAAAEADLEEVAAMFEDFVKGHPAERHARPRDRLRAALFGDAPVAHLVVAARRDVVVGMVQWALVYDPFWSMYGANVDWLYVRPHARGLGVAAALVAEACAQVRRAGGEFLHSAAGVHVAGLYERVAAGSVVREIYLSAEAFQAFADLAGASPRELVRRLPAPELNKVPARPRT